MSLNTSDLVTAQDWIKLAQTLITAARDAAKSGSVPKMQSAADDCSGFIDKRTLACPQDAAHTVGAVQIELSQLIVADDISSIKSRTSQFEAYLQDIQRIAANAQTAADLISFKTASAVVGDLEDIVDDVKAIKTQLDAGNVGGLATRLNQVSDSLQKILDGFNQLKPG